ncbi:MAG: imidazolonepropionase [Oscillospiraceae bacterium]
MEKRNYTHIQALLPEIKAMLAEGKPSGKLPEHYGFRDKQVVKRLLERERRKERKLEAGILPRPKGRPRKDAAPRNIVAEQAYEIHRLQMENKLLRDFLRSTGRK